MKIGRSILLTQKNSPTILFGVGIIGVVATVVLASRATLKLEDTVDETSKNLDEAKRKHYSEHEQYSTQAYQKDVTIQYLRGVGSITKLYGPAFVVGVVSIGCLTGSHHILTTRNTSLMAAYSVLQKGFDEYRARVKGELGPDKDREFRYGTETHEILEETKKGEPIVKQVKRVGPQGASIYARFFDESSDSWDPHPSYNLVFLRTQQNWCNDMLLARGHLFLNEVYDRLGMERSTPGAVVGWLVSKDGDNFVDFGIYDGDNPDAREFVNGRNGSILLDFNVEQIFDKIEKKKKDRSR